jgi:hypothetical protein
MNSNRKRKGLNLTMTFHIRLQNGNKGTKKAPFSQERGFYIND